MKKVKDLCNKAALNLNLPPKFVWEIYTSYWKAVRAHISNIPLKDDSIEENFINTQTSVNIPSLGKFYIDWGKLKRKKERYERYNN